MKRTNAIAVGILAALSLGVASVAQAHPGGMGSAAGSTDGMQGRMGQGHQMGARQHGGMGGAQHGGAGARQHGGATAQGGAAAGPSAGGCPMMAQRNGGAGHTH